MNDSERFEFTQKFFAAWRTLDDSSQTEIPTTGGSIDRALKDVVEGSDDVPDLAKKLFFANGVAGIRCVDFPEMVSLASYAGFGYCMSPAFTWLAIDMGRGVANRILKRCDDRDLYLRFTQKVMDSYQENRSSLPYR